MRTVEESWTVWADSESGKACLDPALLAATVELDRHLAYRLRAAFVAGWIARDCADKPAQVTKEADNE
jgi:hypothetical protein